MKNLEAIADVQARKSPVANATWWGFNPEDATEALQAAIDSGREKGSCSQYAHRLDNSTDSACWKSRIDF